MVNLSYRTEYGAYYHGKIEDALESSVFSNLKGRVNLILTSPPFPLNRKIKYGNLEGEEYLNWFSSLANKFKNLIADDGSIIIELGNSWNKGEPAMSILSLKALMQFLEGGNYKLCQQFVWYNTAKLPSPAQWVNVKRCRVKDSYTNIWWMAKNAYPRADNRKILVPYSSSMNKLLKNQRYNAGTRPSEHNIGDKSFLKDNKGAIPSNVIVSANTESNSDYLKYCKANQIALHPARMPKSIVEYFINFLTEPGDFVLDPFGGSNTTGEVAESLNRNWIAVEANLEYIRGSVGRFQNSITENFLSPCQEF